MRRLCVVGVGLIGASVGLAARRFGAADAIVGVETGTEAADAAVAAGAVDAAGADLAVGIADADCVVLAVPPPQIVALLPRIAALRPENCVVTDTGSTKAAIAAAGAAYPWFVPGHPMAGGERHGPAAGRADLFVGASWPLTPTDATDPDALDRIRAFVEALGAQPFLLDPLAHDRAVALTSHLPHLLAYALQRVAHDRVAAGETHLPRLIAGGFHSATRVAASSPALWRDIALSNREPLRDAARELRGSLDALLEALDAADGDALHRLLLLGHRAPDA